MSWSLADEVSGYADAVLNSFAESGREAIVTAIWPLEVANVLLVAERRQRLTQAQAAKAINLLEALPIAVDDWTSQQTLGTTLELGREYQLPSYDAAYLELALRKMLPIATEDNRLMAAAKRCGLEIYLGGSSTGDRPG
jgi:predicted nucleic acid-binding protein